MKNDTHFEVIIIGGSYAGLSAAMALGRSLRKVLIIDSGLPCNRFTPHSHNFITQDGEPPRVIAEKAKEQVLRYSTVTFQNELVISGSKSKNGFVVITQSGQEFTAKKLVLATGIQDIMPEIEGFADCWGISVIHCPYCHGYEFRDRQTGIMANGERAFHLAMLVNNLTKQLTIYTTGKSNFKKEQLIKLKEHNITIDERIISKIGHENGNIKNIVFNDGSETALTALYASIPFKQHSNIPASLGCEFSEYGHIITDALQKTTLSGVFACGDNSSAMRSVANAVHTGNLAGAVINGELTQEQF